MKLVYSLTLSLMLICCSSMARAACVPDEVEKAVWLGIANTTDPEQIKYYLDNFPKGCFRKLAILKLENLLPARPPLQLVGGQQGGGDLTAGNGDWVRVQVNNGRNSFQKLRVSVLEGLATKLSFNVQCDAAGIGLTPYIPNGGPCPSGSTPFIQGFALRLMGPYAKYYDLKFECITIQFGGVGETPRGPTDDWCGVHNPTPNTWIKGARVDVVRKFEYKESVE